MFRLRTLVRIGHLVVLATLFVVQILRAETTPPEGIRKNTPTVHAFTHARIVQRAGKVIDDANLIIRDGIIVSVGKSATIPGDAKVWDVKGMTLYPGLIDAYSNYGMPEEPDSEKQGAEHNKKMAPPKPEEPRGARSWNNLVIPSQDTELLFVPDSKAAEVLRAQGITSALVVPSKGIIKGSSALVNLGEGTASELIIRSHIAQHMTLEVERGRQTYPTSLMGRIALIRQTLLDAQWYQKVQDAYRRNPALQRPEVNVELAALKDVVAGKMPVVIEASDELMALRAQKIAEEFSLDLIIRGSGLEYRRLEALKATKRAFIVPVNFPEAPDVQSPEDALQYSLRELIAFDQGPENPKRLHETKVTFAISSALLKDNKKFLSMVRQAVERGLSVDDALAALTLTPARLFGVEKQLGSLEAGKIANIVVADGDLFAEKTKIRETWIDGTRYETKPLTQADPRGKWLVRIQGQPEITGTLSLEGELEKLKGSFRITKETKLTTVSLYNDALSFSFGGEDLGHSGVVRMSASIKTEFLDGRGEWPDGSAFTWSASRTGPYVPKVDEPKPKDALTTPFPPLFPLGEFGRGKLPDQASAVLIKNATIWTSGPQGKIENGDLLVRRGKIVKVGRNLNAPSGALTIDGSGKHVTPGLIDAHSHTAISGQVNEFGQAISAEVRVGDVIDSDDINIYRELAGGLTVAHLLHGSANPIGGQNQLIKLRWGMLPDEMKFEGAPPTIKFALGENVKQSNRPDSSPTHYPLTRMGVEQLMRDEFRAALDYEKAWKEYHRGSRLPPRRDLELETILEILKGKRFVHCHSYRQDEILAMMRVAEEFGFKIRVFQHILEGYKVADAMKKHGADASSFSDWWAYKLEVYDAIPYNGALMKDQGLVVSFNSDSDELARRLNTEAAKAVKYGGVSEEEALKFVTLNPAKQLRVDSRVGSLEPGKDADFVIWNGPPLSTYTLCEQTWVDGRKYFDRDEDRQMHAQNQQQRAAIVQKIMSVKKPGESKDDEKKETP